LTKDKIEKFLEFLLPTMQDFVFILIFVVVIGLGPRMLNIDGDLGRHLTVGQYILDKRVIPVNDIFSFTKPGDPLTPHEWLAQLSFAIAYRIAGLNGVVWLCAILLGMTFALLFRLCFKLSNSPLGSFVIVILAAAASSLHWLTRPHLFTMFFFVIWVYLLEQLRNGKSNLWWGLPLVMLLWVNTHGAFIAGFVALFAYLAGQGWDRYFKPVAPGGVANPQWSGFLLGGAGALIVTIINPVGWKIWQTSLGYIQNSYLVGHTAEYLPPNFHDVSTWPFLIMIFLTLVCFGLLRPQYPGALALMTAGWTVMALYSTRNIPLYAIAVAPGLALASHELKDLRHLSNYINLDKKVSEADQRLKGWVSPLIVILLVAIGLLSGMRLDFGGHGNEFSAEVFPVAAANWIDSNPQSGNGFNYFTWGGYLLYRFWPNLHVFIDGQTDFYGEQLTREYETVITEEDGWQAILDKYAIQWLILPSDLAFSKHILINDQWNVLYQDDTSLILRKSQP
jgi:hypothetical protein